MAIRKEYLENMPPASSISQSFAQDTHEQSPHPCTSEGVLLPDWLLHKTTVVDVKPYKDDRVCDAGTFTYDQYTMSDGTAYHVMEGQPRHQSSMVPIDGTTAWYTQPEGHNAITDKELMRLGFHTRRIGPEIFPDVDLLSPLSIARAIRKGWNVSLGYSAHNMLEILEVSDQSNRYTLTPGVSLTTGESRDPMIEPALNLLGLQRDKPRVIAHADSVDPCVPNGLDFSDVKNLARLFLSEAEAIGRTALNVAFSLDAAEYIETADIRPATLIPALTLANALLLSRQAGEVAALRPKTSPMHLSFMRKSYANFREIYEQIYSTHDNVYIATRDGAHMDIPRTRAGVTRRHAKIMEQLASNGDNPEALDLEKVYELPKRPAKGFLRLVS